MSFDVYVGSFTRYISGDWENMGQRAARELGQDYKLIRDNETEEAPPPPEVVREAVLEWRNEINTRLQGHLDALLDWDESDAAPYFTDRPGWRGYAAALLLAAHADHPDLPAPKHVPEEWGDDAAYQKSIERGPESNTRFPTLLLGDLWLPGEFEFMFPFEDLGGNIRKIASTKALHDELRELNGATFQGTTEDLRRWAKLHPSDDAPFEDLARFGLAILMLLADEALKRRLPMMPDY